MKKILMASAFFASALLFMSTAVQAQQTKAKAATKPAVSQMMLGTAVQNREIAGEDSTFNVGEKVYAWMRVIDASGDSVVVTWKHADISYSTTVHIGSNSWRTWVYKTMSASGNWSVTAALTSGEVLKELTFTVK